MKLEKLAILVGSGVISFAVASPAEATWYPHNGGWSNPSGWGSSGWGSSGWGSSGWGSSGWGSSGWGSSGWGSSGWGSSSYGGSTSTSSSTSSGTTSTGSSSGGSSSGGTPIPEPSNVMMLALGVAGLVAGRFAARKKRKKL
ncbi:PEP-CTERM sorting domain-containing protein [Parasphingorhabdus litoris]|uniref:PEP-CTERM sorting domain-containing protein n=1 Tax=Parasphingorhabdus litoris TaxID=394733 RepID=UPI001E47B2F6|nr:PEP-CTERM sorting domain-containing protein [Parasphingorhabdus litoris]